jgi:hypothetical protein
MSLINSGNTSTTGIVVTADATGDLGLLANSGLINAAPTSGAIALPTGTTAQRPGTPINGSIRYNSNTTVVEAYANNSWGALSSGQVNGMFTPNPNTITANFTSAANTNYLSVGVITLSSPYLVNITSTSIWKVV